MIKNGASVSFNYVLSVDGSVVDDSTERGPLSYVHGTGQIIRGLEEQLDGMDVGQKKSVDVPPEKAYGERDPQAVQKVPKAMFDDPEHLQVGNVVQGRAKAGTFRAVVTEIGDGDITLDLNHPLAGKTLHFEVEVVGVETESGR